MKKIAIILFILSFFISCSLPKKGNNKTNVFFSTTKKIKVHAGDYVLAPSKANYDTAMLRGIENTLFVFYPRKVLGETDTSVILEEYGDTSNIPFYLVIPMQRNKKVIAGDIVLTWWQKGTGMQRAIVLNKDSSARPVVYYIDNQYSLYSPATNVNYWIDTLLPNSFLVIKDTLMPGRTVLEKSKDFSNSYLIVSISDKKILGLSWSGNIKILDKKDCIFVPFKKNIKAGDSVEVPYIGMYSRGKVISKWPDIGKLKVKIFFIDTTLETYANIADAIKIK